MKKSLHISTSINQEDLVESMVEELAYHYPNVAVEQVFVSKVWEAVQSSSTETFITGTASVTEEGNETLHVPFITEFIFTCLKGADNRFKLHWSMSCN